MVVEIWSCILSHLVLCFGVARTTVWPDRLWTTLTTYQKADWQSLDLLSSLFCKVIGCNLLHNSSPLIVTSPGDMTLWLSPSRHVLFHDMIESNSFTMSEMAERGECRKQTVIRIRNNSWQFGQGYNFDSNITSSQYINLRNSIQENSQYFADYFTSYKEEL